MIRDSNYALLEFYAIFLEAQLIDGDVKAFELVSVGFLSA